MRNHENWLKAYMEFTALSESPDALHFWTGISTIAGALRRQVWMEHRIFQWTPNFYIIFVGPPGVAAKSTSLRIGMGLLRQVEGVHFGPQSMTWQGLTKALVEAYELVPFGEEFLPMSCLTCEVAELGTFLRPSDRELVDVLVAMWDGAREPWRRRLKQEETVVENPWINVIAATTPSWLGDNFPEVMIGGGLVSRIVFVHGDTKRHLLAYPGDFIDKAAFARQEKALVEDLYSISALKGEYELAKDAKVWGTKWYEQLWTRRPEHMADDYYSGYIARKQTHIHKVAMVLAAAQRDQLAVTLEDLQTAERIVTSLEVDMERVFQSIGTSDISKYAADILHFIKALGKVESVRLWRQCIHRMGPRDYSEAIDALVRAGYLSIKQEGKELHYCAVKEEKEERT